MTEQDVIKRVSENLAQIVLSKQGEAIYSKSVNQFEVWKQENLDLSIERTRANGKGIPVPAWTFVRTLNGTDDSTKILFAAGEDYDGKPLDELKDAENISSPFVISKGMIYNTAQAGKTITIIAYRGFDFKSSLARLVGSVVVSSGVIRTERPTLSSDGSVSMAATSNTKILNANSKRDVAYITNNLALAGWLKSSDTGSAVGRLILPGQTLPVTNTKEIWMYNPDVLTPDGATYTEDYFS